MRSMSVDDFMAELHTAQLKVKTKKKAAAEAYASLRDEAKRKKPAPD